MRKKVCSAYAKKEIIQSILIGSIALPIGIFIAALVVSPSILDFFVLNFARNLAYIFVILFLLFSGAYLLFSGLRGLCSLDSTGICQFIRTELQPKGMNLTGKEMLALVDSDLERGIAFGEGNILIGQEWLFVKNAWGKPIIQLKNIHGIKESKTKNSKVILKIMNQQGVGPVTRELSTTEAGAIRAYLQSNVSHLEC